MIARIECRKHERQIYSVAEDTLTVCEVNAFTVRIFDKSQGQHIPASAIDLGEGFFALIAPEVKP